MANWIDELEAAKTGQRPAKSYKDEDGNIVVTNDDKYIKDKNLQEDER